MAAQRQRDLVVVLEDIHDPHNAAAILRSCDAFGVQTVHFVFVSEEPYDPRRIGKQSSSSANKWLDFQIWNDTGACLEALRADGYLIAATAAEGAGTAPWDCNLTLPVAILVGNEHAGLSEAAIAGADARIAIPMRGLVQSLNVSVTAAILLYEATRQRQHSGAPFTLAEPEADGLFEDFLQR